MFYAGLFAQNLSVQQLVGRFKLLKKLLTRRSRPLQFKYNQKFCRPGPQNGMTRKLKCVHPWYKYSLNVYFIIRDKHRVDWHEELKFESIIETNINSEVAKFYLPSPSPPPPTQSFRTPLRAMHHVYCQKQFFPLNFLVFIPSYAKQILPLETSSH